MALMLDFLRTYQTPSVEQKKDTNEPYNAISTLEWIISQIYFSTPDGARVISLLKTY